MYYSCFSILPYTHNSLLIFCSSIYISPSSRTLSSSIKSTTCNSRFFIRCCATRYWRSSNITTCRTSRACGLIHLNLLAKTTVELFLVGIIFWIFLFNFEFELRLMHFLREVFDTMYEDLLYGYYNLPLKFSGKVLPVTLTFLFFSFILYIPTRLS